MGEIKIMDELLSSKIAAGEVVERPASVVKELVENSIDAGARSISVFVAEGGKRLVRVVDDGRGMDSGDAELTIVRHATSKILSNDDLNAIKTKGFRGEALSSIAAVSRFTLKTRMASSESATVLSTEGGSEPKISQDGSPEGTSVEVSDLFFNTPARLKFLRTPGTEFGRITDIVKRLALAHPEVRVTLVHGSSKVIDSPPGSFSERVSDIVGRAVFKEMVEVSSRSGEEIKVCGFVSRPTSSYTTAKGLYIFVNDRAVRDPGLARAVTAGYGSLLERGRYPAAVLKVELPLSEVDVNVHPAKTEVRFSDPRSVFDAVRRAVAGALAKGLGGAELASATALGGAVSSFRGAEQGAKASFSATSPNTPSRSGESPEPWQRGDVGRGAQAETAPLGLVQAPLGEEVKNPEFLSLEPVGQLWGEFLICESWLNGGEFYIVDQHGAAERARFERLKKGFYKDAVSSQLLLIPESVETTPEEKEALEAALSTLARLGFEIVPFGPSTKKGGETFMVKGAPEILSGRAVGQLIVDLAAELSHTGVSTAVEEEIDSVLMTMACHSVIRGQRILSTEEAKALLRGLSEIDFASHCPHGRPVVKRYTRAEVETLFKRR